VRFSIFMKQGRRSRPPATLLCLVLIYAHLEF
jgi:hypothetical protein